MPLFEPTNLANRVPSANDLFFFVFSREPSQCLEQVPKIIHILLLKILVSQSSNREFRSQIYLFAKVQN